MSESHIRAPRPIETRYKGYRFRSRLEARWAVFFDALGIEWQYEPEGFEANGERYLPDFFLPKSQTWVEVKGCDAALQADASRLATMLDWQSPLPGVMDGADPAYAWDSINVRGLLLLGSIPEKGWGPVLHPIVQHHKGLFLHQAIFQPSGLRKLDLDAWKFLTKHFGAITGDPWSSIEFDFPKWTVASTRVPTPLWSNEVENAYTAARQARFEHGEAP
jgi:hypothetical protein